MAARQQVGSGSPLMHNFIPDEELEVLPGEWIASGEKNN
jgi:hypothetical protein